MAKDIEELCNMNEMKKAYHKIQALTKHQVPKPVVRAIELSEGNITEDHWDFNKFAADYYKKLLTEVDELSLSTIKSQPIFSKTVTSSKQ